VFDDKQQNVTINLLGLLFKN